MSIANLTLSTCRTAFPALRRTQKGQPLAFFDGPGGTQVPRPVMDAVIDYYTHCNANTYLGCLREGSPAGAVSTSALTSKSKGT